MSPGDGFVGPTGANPIGAVTNDHKQNGRWCKAPDKRTEFTINHQIIFVIGFDHCGAEGRNIAGGLDQCHGSWCHGDLHRQVIAGLILGLGPANERRRYFVTTSLIGRTQI